MLPSNRCVDMNIVLIIITVIIIAVLLYKYATKPQTTLIRRDDSGNIVEITTV